MKNTYNLELISNVDMDCVKELISIFRDTEPDDFIYFSLKSLYDRSISHNNQLMFAKALGDIIENILYVIINSFGSKIPINTLNVLRTCLNNILFKELSFTVNDIFIFINFPLFELYEKNVIHNVYFRSKDDYFMIYKKRGFIRKHIDYTIHKMRNSIFDIF